MKKIGREHIYTCTFRYLKTNRRHNKPWKLIIIDRRFNKRGNYQMKPLRLYHKQRSKEKWNEEKSDQTSKRLI